MYIRVRIVTGYKEPLIYKVPEDWHQDELSGCIVRVPLQTRQVLARVIEMMENLPKNIGNFTIKKAIAREPFPNDKHYWPFIKQLSQYYQIDELFCLRRIKQFLSQKEKQIIAEQSVSSMTEPEMVTLTPEQQTIYDKLAPSLQLNQYHPAILHGVTGSGKTEIYKTLIITTHKLQKTTIFLLPEVTLALQFERLLKEQLPADIPVRSFHSATSIKEKRITWQMLINQQPFLLIGVHLPILLPIANLGLIIVDEEHDPGYQEKRAPTINSKEAAIWRAHTNNIPIVLGSATPSMHSLYNVQTRGWHLFKLEKRYAGAFPTIKTVSLLAKQKRRNFWISADLETALAERLAKKEQSIIFLNRRGYSFFMQCKQCSYIPTCTACSVSLTVHENNRLSCHYCGTSKELPTSCPACNADEKKLLKRGIGTQQLVTILEKLFPYARIGRADLDTSSNKKIWKQTMHDFSSGAINILVGTQTITKGYHFPNVTLVGIIWADLNLHFPIYNASETTLQQLLQVAGRAGRTHTSSLVIVQYMAEHEIFSYLDERQYCNFYAAEYARRQELGYPPCNRLIELALKHGDQAIVEHESQLLAKIIKQHLTPSIGTLLGPSKPPVHMIKHIHTRKLYLKGPNMQKLLALIQQSTPKGLKSTIFLTPNPLQ